MDRDTRLYVNRELTKALNDLSDLRRVSSVYSAEKIVDGILRIKIRLIEVEDVIVNQQIKLWKE